MAVNTVKSLSERILRMLNKGDVPMDTRFTMRDVQYAVRDNLGKQIYASWFAGRNSQESKDISDAFVSTVTRQVLADGAGICYAELDFDTVNLPDDTGIQSVRPTVQGTLPDLSAFIPAVARFDDIYRGLPANAIEGQIAWRMKGKRIYFTTKNGQNLILLGVPNVDIDAITTSEIIVGQEKPLPIPPNVAEAIVREVFALFAPMMDIPKDMLFDFNSNIKPVAS